MTSNNIDLSGVCQQRLRQMLYTIPPSRYTPVSPYPTYTQEQLNMRRKAEILKYSNPSQSNKFTKGQKWAQLVKGTARTNVTTTPTQTCNNDMIPTPNYACDVPGPVTYFVRDVRIPLYHYLPNTNAYAVSLTNNTALWSVNTDTDIYLSGNGIPTKIFTLSITDKIDNPIYNFQYQTPIGLYIRGNTTTLQLIDIPDLSFGINLITSSVLYNGSNVTLNTTPVTTPSTNIPKISFDLSFVPQSSYTSYDLIYYAGFISVSNIELYTEPGFIYDFYLSVYTNTIDSQNEFYSNNFTTSQYGIYCNLSESNKYISSNAIINTIPYNRAYGSFSLSGVKG